MCCGTIEPAKVWWLCRLRREECAQEADAVTLGASTAAATHLGPAQRQLIEQLCSGLLILLQQRHSQQQQAEWLRAIPGSCRCAHRRCLLQLSAQLCCLLLFLVLLAWCLRLSDVQPARAGVESLALPPCDHTSAAAVAGSSSSTWQLW